MFFIVVVPKRKFSLRFSPFSKCAKCANHAQTMRKQCANNAQIMRKPSANNAQVMRKRPGGGAGPRRPGPDSRAPGGKGGKGGGGLWPPKTSSFLRFSSISRKKYRFPIVFHRFCAKTSISLKFFTFFKRTLHMITPNHHLEPLNPFKIRPNLKHK